MPKRLLQGIVTSDKGNKTVTVQVDRRVQHPIYKKTVTKSKKYYAHDENNQSKVGDKVTIRESKPISKLKRWIVVYEGAEQEAAKKPAKAKTNKK